VIRVTSLFQTRRPRTSWDAWGRKHRVRTVWSSRRAGDEAVVGARRSAFEDGGYEGRVNLIERQRDPQRERSGHHRATPDTADLVRSSLLAAEESRPAGAHHATIGNDELRGCCADSSEQRLSSQHESAPSEKWRRGTQVHGPGPVHATRLAGQEPRPRHDPDVAIALVRGRGLAAPKRSRGAGVWCQLSRGAAGVSGSAITLGAA
jgi:hypothetical protein